MIDPTWRIEPPDEEAAAAEQPALVSFHFLRAELHRRWPVWVALGCVGLLLGLAWTIVLPAKGVGTTTMLLAHDPQTDPDQAMTTDVSMLRTRTVAGEVIDRLGLALTPEEFQSTVTVTPLSSRVLTVDVAAPDDAAAVARARALSAAFLRFRSDQFRAQTNALVGGYRKRLSSMQRQVETLTKQFTALDENDPSAQSRATDLLARRSQVTTDINSLEQTVQDTTLQTNSIIATSQVIDPASAVPRSPMFRLALAMASGLIGGVAIGMGLILFLAITSNRLRRREDVALALGLPVRFSAGSLHERRRRVLRFARRGPPGRNLEVLSRGVTSAISPLKRRPVERASSSRKGQARKSPTPRKAAAVRLALATVDNAGAGKLVTARVAADLVGLGSSVFVVDLSESGGLDQALAGALDEQHQLGSKDGPVLFRPEGVPALSRGPGDGGTAGASDLPRTHPQRRSWENADVALTLAEVDPAAGVEHLKSWSDKVVLLVSAGRSSAERLRTTAELLRASGVDLLFAMMVDADRTDESLGLPDNDESAPSGARRTS